MYAWLAEGLPPDERKKLDEDLYAPLNGVSLWALIMRSEDDEAEGST